MPDVQLNGKTVTIERFKLSKAMRVITLLRLIQKQAPEITKEWANFRKSYAEDYGRDMDRLNALATFGPALEHVTEADWERSGQKFHVPGQPSGAEVFFAIAPTVYEKAETVVLRLLGLIAMPNEMVDRYVNTGDIWERVDEYVDELIVPAALDEIMELALTAAEVIDGQVLAKAKEAGDRAGNVARLLGWKGETTPSPNASPTSSEQPEQPSSPSSQDSPSGSDGSPTPSADSTGTTSESSGTTSLQTA